jgi:hypothetical protein
MPAEENKLKGNIKHSVVFWCFNIAGERWDIDRTCTVAKSLGCKSVEICGPAEWPTLKKYGLTCAMASNGMPGRLSYCAGVNNDSESHRERHAWPTSDPASRMRNRSPRCASSWPMARPACPPPITSTSSGPSMEAGGWVTA